MKLKFKNKSFYRSSKKGLLVAYLNDKESYLNKSVICNGKSIKAIKRKSFKSLKNLKIKKLRIMVAGSCYNQIAFIKIKQ